MKANELRIGNHLHYGDGVTIVDINVLRDFDIYSRSGISPIPLTEERFIEFGLIKLRSPVLSFVMGCYEISLIPTTGEFGVYLPSGRIITSIRYAHQLQNLYFALIGEELTICKQ